MHLVQLLLPLTTAADARKARFETILEELTSRFGGATAYVHSPAKGIWQGDGERQHDRIVTIEVMVDEIDADWWSTYRRKLENDFDQKELLVRAIETRKL